MKLSTKLLLGLFGISILLTFITMFKIQQWNSEFNKDINKGNKNWIELEFPLQSFNSLEAGNHLTVNWHRGAPMVKVKIEENLKSFIKVEQSGAHVKILFDSLTNYRTSGTIVVNVYSESLEKLHLRDFVKFKTEDSIREKRLELEIEDHNESTIWINVDTLNLQMYDFCELELYGKVNTSLVQMNGHSHLDGRRFVFQQVDLQMDDFTKSNIQVMKYIKASLKDHAKMSYTGDSVVAEIKTRDFSSVNSD